MGASEKGRGRREGGMEVGKGREEWRRERKGARQGLEGSEKGMGVTEV